MEVVKYISTQVSSRVCLIERRRWWIKGARLIVQRFRDIACQLPPRLRRADEGSETDGIDTSGSSVITLDVISVKLSLVLSAEASQDVLDNLSAKISSAGNEVVD